MECTLATLRARDKKEQKLDCLTAQLNLCDADKKVKKARLEQYTEQYQKWKEENKCPGVKY